MNENEDAEMAAMTTIWAETLGTTPAPDENFFDLGGHSLTAAKIMHRTEVRTGVRLPATVLYDHPTVRAFVRELARRTTVS
ncbi:acyl carrier protein [Nocardia panacis]|uniref:Acyl carrier protein n=1 Tax=Nocardia panacis TaxID=2340916 RepID=A0A3A4KBB0_9NOCA|nr:acyl carrier protein [Nocardia panacis]RJO70730.1 acyl carrier protein [Nocardia panacis]